jgi:hypothetical protein
MRRLHADLTLLGTDDAACCVDAAGTPPKEQRRYSRSLGETGLVSAEPRKHQHETWLRILSRG